jgi:hypothetical protein
MVMTVPREGWYCGWIFPPYAVFILSDFGIMTLRSGKDAHPTRHADS